MHELSPEDILDESCFGNINGVNEAEELDSDATQLNYEDNDDKIEYCEIKDKNKMGELNKDASLSSSGDVLEKCYKSYKKDNKSNAEHMVDALWSMSEDDVDKNCLNDDTKDVHDFQDTNQNEVHETQKEMLRFVMDNSYLNIGNNDNEEIEDKDKLDEANNEDDPQSRLDDVVDNSCFEESHKYREDRGVDKNEDFNDLLQPTSDGFKDNTVLRENSLNANKKTGMIACACQESIDDKWEQRVAYQMLQICEDDVERDLCRVLDTTAEYSQVGKELRLLGFSHLDGIADSLDDIDNISLNGVYNRLYLLLKGSGQIPTMNDTYDFVVARSGGVIDLSKQIFVEFIRIVRKGGHIVLTGTCKAVPVQDQTDSETVSWRHLVDNENVLRRTELVSERCGCLVYKVIK